MKKCRKCGSVKSELDFYKRTQSYDGLDYLCKNCRKQINRQHYKQYHFTDNKEFIETLKTNCIKCGEDRKWVIEFHHIEPSEKSFIISNCGTRSKSSLLKEAAKCICLCANCHKELHYFFGLHLENGNDALNKYLDEDY